LKEMIMGLEEALLRLSSLDEGDRIYAAEDIGLAGQPEGVDPLIQRVVQEPSQAVREAIFAALSQIPGDAVIERAAQLLSSDDSGIRNQAVGLLQSRGGAAVPQLRRLLAADDQDMRKFGVDVLSRIETPEIAELLEIALGDNDVNVVIAALECVRDCHASALRQTVLQHALSDGHPMLVLAAMEALGRIGDAECFQRIRERFPTLEATPALYIEAALKLLGANAANGDLLELRNYLNTCEPSLRANVLDAFRNLLARAGTAAIPDVWWQDLLARLPETTSLAERYQTLALLGHFAYREQVFEVLIAYLQSPNKVDRLGAIEALSNNPFVDATGTMRSRLQWERDPEVRQTLEDALWVTQ
jgi:HEAT repeat protein